MGKIVNVGKGVVGSMIVCGAGVGSGLGIVGLPALDDFVLPALEEDAQSHLHDFANVFPPAFVLKRLKCIVAVMKTRCE